MVLDGEGLLVRLRTELSGLPEALQRVAELILRDPEEAAQATIVDLAERSGTSPATVTRFCRTLGFRGYAGLRVAIATEIGRAAQARWEIDVDRDIAPDHSLQRVLGVIVNADTQAIRETADRLDLDAIEVVASTIAASIGTGRRVEVFGVGSSAAATTELVFRLQRLRVACWHRAEAHSALSSAALLRPGDLAIGVSHSGRTREVIEFLAEAAEHGAMTVAVTSYPRSPLAGTAELVLTTETHETSFRLASLSALHSQLLVLDLVYVAVAQRSHPAVDEAFELTARAVQTHRLPEDPIRKGKHR
ncbi:MurR/RpiR family transcriptional regulator [Allokutzneria multivorans]|uniref:MurR/RpiR family transcriptional regulator n=1 Tax=Allokutzneria multivorans TaxID=1142134 RepID=A0ABP7QPU8_9PSEU